MVEPEQLLGAAVMSLLSREDGLQVLSFTPDTVAELIEKIAQLQLDAVIIDQASHFISAIRLLSAHHSSRLCLMTVNANNNWVNIEHRQRVLITKPSDLANLIHCNLGQSVVRTHRQNGKEKIFSHNLYINE